MKNMNLSSTLMMVGDSKEFNTQERMIRTPQQASKNLKRGIFTSAASS